MLHKNSLPSGKNSLLAAQNFPASASTDSRERAPFQWLGGNFPGPNREFSLFSGNLPTAHWKI
jgi:hypothetical protein